MSFPSFIIHTSLCYLGLTVPAYPPTNPAHTPPSVTATSWNAGWRYVHRLTQASYSQWYKDLWRQVFLAERSHCMSASNICGTSRLYRTIWYRNTGLTISLTNRFAVSCGRNTQSFFYLSQTILVFHSLPPAGRFYPFTRQGS